MRSRIAILGCGTMGMTHAANLAIMPGVQVVGVCDLLDERLKAAAEVTGARVYKDIEELLSAETPDVVIVCLPTYLHKQYVLRIAELGIHIVCEKPIAPTPEEGKEMLTACQQHGVRLFIGHVVRFFPNYRHAADQVKAGRIGKPRVGHLKRFGSFPKGWELWYHDRSKSGGVIMDLMIHDIDFARSVFGDVVSVYARISSNLENEMEYAQVTLNFVNGAAANLTGLWGYAGPFTTQFELAGDGGITRFDSNDSSAVTMHQKKDDTSKAALVQVPQSPLKHNPYYDEMAHFLACINEGSEPLVTVEDACKAVEIALAAERSAKLGQPVVLGGYCT